VAEVEVRLSLPLNMIFLSRGFLGFCLAFDRSEKYGGFLAVKLSVRSLYPYLLPKLNLV
jgi:hypothetical protein